jgi:hypothetical protein
MDGQKTGTGGNLTTANAASWLPAHGFVPGSGGPGDFRVGYNGEHMQATLPGGTPWNWGSDAAAANRGVGGSGAFDPAFTSHYYRPAGTSSGAGQTTTPGAPSGAPPTLADLFSGLTGFGGQGGPGLYLKRSPASGFDIKNPPPLPPGASSWHLNADGTATAVDGNFKPVGSAPPPPSSAPSGLPEVSGNAWANNKAGVPLGAPLTQPNIGPGPIQGDFGGIGQPGPGGAAPGNVGPFGVPHQVANKPSPWWTKPGSAAAPGPGQGPTAIGGVTPPAGSGSGGVGLTEGGSLDTALNLGAAAVPGLGQAAQTGVKLANRAIKFAGQATAIGIQGLEQTFLPTGGSQLAENSWFSKILGGIAGAAPALPNMAGKKASAPDKQGQQGQGADGQQGGDTHITVNNQRANEDGTGRDIAWHQQNQNEPAGSPWG